MLQHSDAFVFFGATGDLAHKKIFPALQSMVEQGTLEGAGHRCCQIRLEFRQLRERARDSIIKYGGGAGRRTFHQPVRAADYLDGDYKDDKTYETLHTILGAAKCPTHYLAIPPQHVCRCGAGLEKSGSAKNARVILEKPFGRDLLRPASSMTRCTRRFRKKTSSASITIWAKKRWRTC